MAPKALGGVMVALVTPFKDSSKSVDTDALDKHINRLIDAGVHGLVPGGSTGEFTALSTEERKVLVEQTVRSAAGRATVVAGVGDLSTARTAELAAHAAEVGADALMVVPPFYDAPNLAQLREYLKDISTAANGLPIVYYNIPSASGVTLSPDEIVGLADVGVHYMKDTSGNGPALTELLFSKAHQAVTCFNGWDTLTFYGLAAGAKGSIWGATNIIPELSMQLWTALAEKGDLAQGRELWTKIFPICKFLESHNYASAVKTGMELRGWSTGGLRKPFSLLEDKHENELRKILQDSGVL
ncbi:hypothetical protein F5Y06DRAFT_18565 [Hypoxylon sp. FL0890]|nr:hypothetical protein F5Y06DRAFT_18565 [Hypoxylon sp. FL0890]